MPTRTESITWTKQYLGRRDNRGKFMWILAGMPQFIGSAWCGATIVADHRALGIELDWISDREMIYTPAIVTRARQAGLWQASVHAKPGDLVLFDWQGHEDSPADNADHVGRLVHNDPKLPYVTAIGGNTSDGVHMNLERGVFIRRRYRSEIMGTVDLSKWFDSKKVTKPHKGKLVVVDGWFGPNMARALGAHDGVMSGQPVTLVDNLWAVPCAEIVARHRAQGSRMVARIQHALGVKADGFMGPHTIRALQRKLGVKVDGFMGHKTVRAFQKALNSGKLVIA